MSIPDYLKHYFPGKTDWSFLVEIVQSGKHPTNYALACALRSQNPVPDEIREYLAHYLVEGWPQSGRTKTPWEKHELTAQFFEDGESLEAHHDAVIEVQHEWALIKVAKAQVKTGYIAQAIEQAAAKQRKMPPGWPMLDATDLTALVHGLQCSGKWSPKTLAKKKFDSTLNEIAEQFQVNVERLAEFFRTAAQKQDFRHLSDKD